LDGAEPDDEPGGSLGATDDGAVGEDGELDPQADHIAVAATNATQSIPVRVVMKVSRCYQLLSVV
jgi:hypothetical protein